MANQQWREQLAQALRRQGLPATYIERLVEELSDHATDLFKEENKMNADGSKSDKLTPEQINTQLGSPEKIATTAKREFQQRTFAGRHPILMFLAMPLLAAVLTLVASVLAMVGLAYLSDAVTGGALSANDLAAGPPSTLEWLLMSGFNCLVQFTPFALPAWLFFKMGRRSGREAWGAVACGILAALAISFHSTLGELPNGQGFWTIAFDWHIGFVQPLQAAVPLACIALIARKLLRDRAQTLAT